MSNNWIDYLSTKKAPHRQLELYLRINGWSTYKKRADATAYSSPDGILRKYIPTNSDYLDYKEGLLFVIDELSKHFKKDTDEFVLDVFEKAEVFRFRFDSNLSLKQNIALQELCDFSNHIMRTISKASSEVDVLSKQRRIRVNELLESCQIGQTQPGSYIIKLFIPKIEINTLDFKPEEKRIIRPLVHRYQRFVSEEIYKNYQALYGLSNNITDANEEEEIDYFILKNLAVSQSVATAIESNNEYFEVMPKWSGWIPQPAESSQEVYFEAKDFDWLPERIEKVKAHSLLEKKTIVGFVLNTSRNLDKEGKKTSDPYIKIRYYDGKETRHARLEVTEEQYTEALEAARPNSNLAIGIKARITRRPKVDLIFKEHISAFQLHSMDK